MCNAKHLVPFVACQLRIAVFLCRLSSSCLCIASLLYIPRLDQSYDSSNAFLTSSNVVNVAAAAGTALNNVGLRPTQNALTPSVL